MTYKYVAQLSKLGAVFLMQILKIEGLLYKSHLRHELILVYYRFDANNPKDKASIVLLNLESWTLKKISNIAKSLNLANRKFILLFKKKEKIISLLKDRFKVRGDQPIERPYKHFLINRKSIRFLCVYMQTVISDYGLEMCYNKNKYKIMMTTTTNGQSFMTPQIKVVKSNQTNQALYVAIHMLMHWLDSNVW